MVDKRKNQRFFLRKFVPAAQIRRLWKGRVFWVGSRRSAGHLAALFTIITWGTTFISTKVLLTDFRPVEILFFRFVMDFAALLLVCPHRLKTVSRRQEMTFVLAVLAAFVWACYSLQTRKISSFGYPVILTTRRTFFYGILFMVPALFLFDFEVGLERFADMTCLLNILYLGLGASALCFVTWNLAVKALGGSEDQRLYLHGSRHNGCDIRIGTEGAGDMGFGSGDSSGSRGAFLSEYSGKGSGEDE